MRDVFAPGKDFNTKKERDRAICNEIDRGIPLYEIEKKYDLAFATVEKIERDYKNGNLNFQEA